MRFELPTFEFKAGETKEFRVTLKLKSGAIVSPEDTSAFCAISNYVNLTDSPSIRKPCHIKTKEPPFITFTLLPEDTIHLPTGKYIYQLTIKGQDNIVDISCGVFILHANLDKESITA